MGMEEVWLRTQVRGYLADFQYSYDGIHFQKTDQIYPICWGSYRGDRIGIYTFNNTADEGFVDVDYFDYNYTGSISRWTE